MYVFIALVNHLTVKTTYRNLNWVSFLALEAFEKQSD